MSSATAEVPTRAHDVAADQPAVEAVGLVKAYVDDGSAGGAVWRPGPSLGGRAAGAVRPGRGRRPYGQDLIGFRPDAGPLGWLAAAGVLLLFIGAISWLAAAVGLLARSPEAAGGFVFLVSFLPYPSSAFVPVETMPTWLHGVASNQPVTPVIETLRGLLLGLPLGSSPAKAVAWCLGILVASVAISGVLFRRRTA